MDVSYGCLHLRCYIGFMDGNQKSKESPPVGQILHPFTDPESSASKNLQPGRQPSAKAEDRAGELHVTLLACRKREQRVCQKGVP